MKKLIYFFFAVAISICLSQPNLYAAGRMNVVATTTTLASIASEIAGDKIAISAIASPKQNIHFYAPTPKDVLRVKKADVFIHQGLDLEAWRQPLLDAAGNLRFLGEGKYSIDVSKGISLLEIPTTLSRAEGDIHIYGNPHYIGDPENAEIVASNIAEGLAAVEPENAAFFRKNAEEFNKRLDAKIKDWEARMAKFQGAPIVTYHRSWSYFVKRFGLTVVGEIEPKPGIPPTAKHIGELIGQIKGENAKVIIKEYFEENRTPKKIAAETGIRIVNLSQTVGGPEAAKDYVSLMEQNISLLEDALSGQKGQTV
ncbi:MAG: metal ABC transporter substrate-binding protein [Candidatus Omnitrophica bacterium]|nr:metal ABC transporter substrate-binding protein [Candidatus Omnitrophota bacterium]MDD5670715.1 metal ABC transporter substrate-binding protein [Candidatus Omnitrophota bacterium]